MHGLLRRHPARGARVELPELFPRLPPELHKEMGSLAGLSGRRCADAELHPGFCVNVCSNQICFPQTRLKAGVVPPAKTWP